MSNQNISAGSLLRDESFQARAPGLGYADPAIQNILVRLNHIFAVRFPGFEMATISSCSGHVEQLDTGFRPEPDETPYLHIRGKGEGCLRGLEDVADILRDLASGAANHVARAMPGTKIEIKLLSDDTSSVLEPAVASADMLLGITCSPVQTWQSLRCFWNAFELELQRYDGRSLLTELAVPHFLPSAAAAYRSAIERQ